MSLFGLVVDDCDVIVKLWDLQNNSVLLEVVAVLVFESEDSPQGAAEDLDTNKEVLVCLVVQKPQWKLILEVGNDPNQSHEQV